MLSARVCLSATVLSLAGACAPVAIAQVGTTAQVSLYRTEHHTLRSERVGAEFQVRVRLPDSYAAASSASRRYPVVYLLDGDLLFGLTSDALQYLEWGRLVPEVIVVAPAYGSIHTPDNGGRNMRNRDFSVFPAQAGYVAGGGERFLAFLLDELRPFVVQRFRVDTSDRTLIGFSRGADLAIHTLFTAPDAFSRYVALDNFYPDYLRLERTYAASHKDLAAKLFLSGRYPRAGMSDLADSLSTRRYPGLSVEYVDAHPRHWAVPGDGVTRGLISVFGKRSMLALLLPLATRNQVDSAVAEYRRLKATSSQHDFGETELADLGLALAQSRRFADAIRVYRLNLETYPASVTTLRRLGAAQEGAGDPRSALESYRAALRSDPNDAAAAAAVRRLEANPRP